MASHKVIARLLKIKECKLIDVSFHHDQLVRLYVKQYKNGCLCPQCGRRGTIVSSRPEAREWQALSVDLAKATMRQLVVSLLHLIGDQLIV